MLEGAFSFSGRVGRLNYFLANLLLIPAFVVGAIVIALLMAAAERSVASVVFFIFLGLLLVIATVWYSLSLQARRIRDIGWDPLTVLVGAFMIALADVVLAKIVPAMALGHHQAGTGIGSFVNLILSLCLLFYPGRAGNFDGDADSGAPDISRASSRLDGRVSTPVAAPIRLPGAAPQGFGKRGVH